MTHEIIHRIRPKGMSFDALTLQDVDLMMSYINSYVRKKLNNQSAHRLLSNLRGEDTLSALGTVLILANKINLTPALLKN